MPRSDSPAAAPERAPIDAGVDERRRVRAWRPAEVALVALAAIAVVALLRWAEHFFIPLVAGILIAYALRPIVGAVERLRVPRPVSAAAALVLLVAAVGAGGYALEDDFARAIAALPDAARKIRVAVVRSERARPGPIAHVQEAAKELEKAATEPVSTARPAPKPPVAVIAKPGVATRVQAFVLKQAASAVGAVAQLGLAALLAFFLLVAGDAFRRNLMRAVGPSLARKRTMIEVLEEIDRQVQRYMFVTLVTNVTIAAAIGVFAAAVGLDNPASWGIAAGILHLVPYIGAGVAAAAIAVAAFLQFETAASAVSLGIGTVAIAVAIGMVFQTWLQSRASRINAAVTFVGLLFFGWLWGAWGLVLGAPLVGVTKTIADRVAEPVGTLLG